MSASMLVVTIACTLLVHSMALTVCALSCLYASVTQPELEIKDEAVNESEPEHDDTYDNNTTGISSSCNNNTNNNSSGSNNSLGHNSSANTNSGNNYSVSGSAAGGDSASASAAPAPVAAMSRRAYRKTVGAGAAGRMPTAAQRVQLSAQHNTQQRQQQQQQARSGSGNDTASRGPSNGAHNVQRAPAHVRHTDNSMQPPVQVRCAALAL
jgi:hypothetical protein